MIVMLQFATLTLATVLALAAAVAFDWLLLRLAFLLMRPAAVRSTAPGPRLQSGTMRVARAWSARS